MHLVFSHIFVFPQRKITSPNECEKLMKPKLSTILGFKVITN